MTETKIILKYYLSPNDRYAVFIYETGYKIICPLLYKYQIDIKSFSKDLINYKNIILKDYINKDELEEDINSKDFEYELNDKIFSDSSQEEESSENELKIKNKYKKIEGLIETINYTKNYFEMKEGIINEKYIILFTDLFNIDFIDDDEIKKKFNKLKSNKEAIFLLVGKHKNIYEENDIISNNEYNFIKKYIINKFRDESKIINFENMTKIKTILSHNNVIKDEIIYPNEIYK